MTNPRPAIPATRTSRPSVAGAVRRFFVSAQRSGVAEGANAASALARAYLYADLTPVDREDFVVVLTALLDDPDVAVRRALAEAFASARRAPRALVVALASDHRPEVAAPLLARSPLLSDAELVDCVAAGAAVAQCSVARRPSLGVGPAAALAEVGTREAVLALISNLSANLTSGSLARLMERFGDDAEVLQALGDRPDLPARVEANIVISTLGRDQGSTEEALGRATRNGALAAIAAACPEDELPDLVRTLRARGALTTALLLRSLLAGERALFAAALAELAGLSQARVVRLLQDPTGSGFSAAASKAGLPPRSLPAFRAALMAIAGRGAEGRSPKSGLLAKLIAACQAEGDPAHSSVLAFLRRLAAEPERAEAQAATDRRVLPPSLDFAPANDEAGVGGVAPPVEIPPDLVLALDAA